MSTYDELVQQAIMAGVTPEEARKRASLAIEAATPTDPENMTHDQLLQSLRDMPAEAFASSPVPTEDLRARFEGMSDEDAVEFNAKYGITAELLDMSREEQSAYWADQRAEAARLKTATQARNAAVDALVSRGATKDEAERSVSPVATFMPEKRGPSEVQKLQAQLRNASRADMGLPEDDEAADVQARLAVELSKAARA